VVENWTLNFAQRIKIAMTDNNQNWLEVPQRVHQLYHKYKDDAQCLLKQAQNNPWGWVLETEELGPVLLKTSADKPEVNAPGVKQVHKGTGFFPTVGAGMDAAESAMGGPNPLTAMLLSGALAGGAGLGAGYLARYLWPETYEKRFPWSLGLLGALGGAGGSFLWHGYPGIANEGWRRMLEASPMQGGRPYGPKPGEATPLTPQASVESRFDDVLERLERKCHVKAAFDGFWGGSSAGSDLSEALANVDIQEAMNVVVEDPHLENKEKALVGGLFGATGAARESRLVSPNDVKGMAINLGLGYGYGYLGSVMAKFLGLGKPVQQGLQNAGILAGAIRGITGL
jgi:hypothetical protein